MGTRRSILLIDDNDAYREDLRKQLEEAGYDVAGVAKGEEAVNLVGQNPQQFEFAVIDQVLKEGDGIETTRQLSSISRKLFILVFTNLWFDEEEWAEYQYKALSAGAHRYIQRHAEEEPKKTIVEFADEIKALAELSDWVAHYHEQMSNVPSLLTQLDIGMDIIDRSHKVWYMSSAFRRITGYAGKDLPKQPCSFWHGYRFFPCFGCLVERTTQDCGNHNEIFLSPLPFREEGKLFYLNVWTCPFPTPSGGLLLGPDGRPLAVMESVQDLSESEQIRNMPIDQRLDIVARSLHACSVEKKYVPTRQFRHVKIYQRLPGRADEFALTATAGYRTAFLLRKKRLTLRPQERYKEAIERMLNDRKGTYFQESGRKDPLDIEVPAPKFVLWPVMQHNKPIAWIEASGEECSQDGVLRIEPYAKEVLRVIECSESRNQEFLSSSTESELAQIDNKLQTVSSAADALKWLIEAACEHTDSYAPVVRYVEGEQAVLLRLGLEKFRSYEKVAEHSYPLSHGASWSVRTINSCQTQRTSDERVIKERQAQLSESAKEVLKHVRSLYFEPLFYNERCIGSFGLHSEYVDNYDDGKRRLIEEITGRIAGALYDYLVEQRTQARAKHPLDRTKELNGGKRDRHAKRKKIFLSYKSEEKELVEGFVAVLELLGYQVWYDRTTVQPRNTILRQVQDGIEASSVVVCFITPNYKDKRYLKDELDLALKQLVERRGFQIVPLLFEKDGKTGQLPAVLAGRGIAALGPFRSDVKTLVALHEALQKRPNENS